MRFDAKGWARRGAVIEPTESRYAKPNKRNIIVMHYTAGYNASSAINTFLRQKKPRSSAHFVVDVDGTITQMVSTAHIAFHSGGGVYRGKRNVNSFSIGIEIVNPGYHFLADDGGYLNWQRKPVSQSRLKPFPGMTKAYEEWVGSTAYWPNYPVEQLDAVEKLTRGLLSQYSTITDVVRHKDVDGRRKIKVDPGPAFPMLRFRKLVSQREQPDEPVYEAEVTVDKLNVRGGPDVAFEKLEWGPLGKGDFVQVLDSSGRWDFVQRWIDGTPYHGWAHTAYLEPR